MATLLSHAGYNLRVEDRDLPELVIRVEDLERVAAKVVDQALDIAKGVIESSLARFEREDTLPADASRQILDRLILSGKSCNLRMIRPMIRDKFRSSDRYIEGVTQIIFQPEYAKRATRSAPVRLRRSGIPDMIPRARSIAFAGARITSISTSITCSFPSLARSVSKIQTTSWPTRSSRGTSRSLNWTSRTTARPAVSRSGSSISSDPLASSGSITRQTTASTGAHSTWPSLADEAGISVDDLQKQLELSFEISSELDITLHFRRQKTGYRRFPADAHSIAIGTELARALESAGARATNGADGETTRWNPTKELAWDIAVNVTDEGHHMLFPAGTTFDQIARVDDQSTLRFATASGPMPDPPRDGEYRISATPPG